MAKISVSKTDVPCSNQGTPATYVQIGGGGLIVYFSKRVVKISILLVISGLNALSFKNYA